MKKYLFPLLFLGLSLNASERLSMSGEYLCWWMKKSPEPLPLVAQVDLGPQFFLGLDLPDASLDLGETPISTNIHSGARFAITGHITDTYGLQASYLFLPKTSYSTSISSDGSETDPFLVIPFFDVTLNQQSSTDLSFPGMYGGEATLTIKNSMQSAEGLFFAKCYANRSLDLRFLTGFKWWYFSEHLTFDTSSPGLPPPPEQVQITEDSFKVRNNFYGALLGLSTEWTKNWFHMEMAGKISLGAMQSNLKITGQLFSNIINDFSSVETYVGGYFALPTNIGSFHTTHFAIIPEANLNLLFDLKKWVALQIGYTFLYVNKVLWAGNAMDDNINPTQSLAIDQTSTLVGPAAPQPQFQMENFWVQGLNVGLNFTY